ncbi:MAG: hypothetical protein AABZ92_05820, partial [Verrucomicrobiota bacterium]
MNRVSSFFDRSFSSFVAIFGKSLSSSCKIQAVANSFFKNTAINRKERSFLLFLIKQFHNRFTVDSFKTNKKINSHQVLELKNLFSKESFFDFDILLESSKVCLRRLIYSLVFKLRMYNMKFFGK